MTAATAGPALPAPDARGPVREEQEGHGCVTVRSHRFTAAAGTRSGAVLRLHPGHDRAEETTAALLLDETARPGESAARYAAVRGGSAHAVQEAVRLASDRLGRPWPAPRIPGLPPTAPARTALVTRPREDLVPADLVDALLDQLPRGSFDVTVQAHLTAEERLLIPAGAVPVRETVHTGAVVIDVLAHGSPVADVDLAWSGCVPPDIGGLCRRAEQAVQRATAPQRPAPPRMQLLLVDGSAGAFLHEVCGHLLESSRQRPSLLAGYRQRQVAHPGLSIADDPRHDAGFGSHRYTMLGAAARRRPMLTAGRLTGLLEDRPDGPWRAEDARHIPQPRMTHLDLAPAARGLDLDRALGAARAPVVRVHRMGAGSLDHRDGTVVLEVKDAVLLEGPRSHRLAPFRVTAEARRLLLGIRAVGCAATVTTWSAYCLAASGRLPVGASTPTVLTGPLSVLSRTPPGPSAASRPGSIRP
ncbi:metallopeptidase TldD-related protein [Kitasatospora sp. NPDC048540]|uniref:metallopeptidase TldD-related protein n=1 Tax=unclassified Kitasatospora TaxID=2633591 RepID=UPI00053B96BC|nr:metallopeptidase TldD-related protein [Kitasatospora sp. MBT63]